MIESQEVHTIISIKELLARLKSRKYLTKLVSVGVGIILISWLLSQLDLSVAIEIIRDVPISLLIVGFLCYAASFYLRAVRFKLLLPKDQPVQHLFPIILVHYTALNIIPARLGELSYVYLLKKVNNVSPGCSLSSLILARVFDQIAISILFLIFSRFVNLPTPWLNTLKWSVEIFLVVILAILILILAYKDKFVDLLKKLLIRVKGDRYPVTQRIMHQLENIVEAFQAIQVKKQALKVLGLSLLIWLCLFSVNYALLKAFDVPLAYAETVLASTVIILSALPLASLSFFGLHEITWTGLAVALGVPKNVAIVSAFGTHIIATMYLFLFGILGLWKISSIEGKKRNTR
jgi:uncharacterized protein (TIRG00374 family)